MEKIAKEKNMSVEDVFIEYMDMNVAITAEAEEKFQAEMEKSLGSNPFSGLNKEQFSIFYTSMHQFLYTRKFRTLRHATGCCNFLVY